MLYFFTDPYEDEIMYSALCRYNKYSGNLSHRKTQEELFGRRTSNQSSNFPCYLEYFSKQFINKSTYSADYFINNHTIFPIYRPFLPKDRTLQLLNDMKGDKAVSIHMRIGEMAGGICKNFGIRVCLKCMDEDIKIYGEPYIHRIHQVPGNQICNRHSEVLMKIVSPRFPGKGELVDINDCSIESSNQVVNDDNLRCFVDLASDISRIFEEPLDIMNFEDIIKKYKIMLMKKGFSSIGGIINWNRVEEEFLNFYPSDFLNKLKSNIRKEDSYKWMRKFFKGINLVHPIRHLLFIRFLFGSVNNLIMFDELEYMPFGKGPWPCLNPAAPHYKREVVTDLDLSKRSKATEPLGIFKCDCGYTYTRIGPDGDTDDRYKKRMVKSYGDTWLNVLKSNIQKQVYTISNLENIMECDSKTIGKYAKELGVFHLLNSKMKTEPIRLNNTPKYDKSLEEIYKSDIILFIKSNPNSTRKDIEQNLLKQYTWLRRYRKDWLNAILPKPLDKRKRKSHVNWSDRDNELSTKVQKIIKEIESKEYNIKITMGFLCRELKFPIHKHLDKLPKTAHILTKNMIIKE